VSWPARASSRQPHTGRHRMCGTPGNDERRLLEQKDSCTAAARELAPSSEALDTPTSLHPDAGDSPFDTVRVGARKEQMLLLEDGLHRRRAQKVIEP
jgi:hypothetical protein